MHTVGIAQVMGGGRSGREGGELLHGLPAIETSLTWTGTIIYGFNNKDRMAR